MPNHERLLWHNFLRVKGWYPAYYGPSGAVFIKRGHASPVEVAETFRRLRNSQGALNLFDYAIAIGDFHTAWSVLDQLDGDLRRSTDPKRLESILRYRQAHRELRAGDYAAAENSFLEALKGKTISERDALILKLLQAIRGGQEQSIAGKYQSDRPGPTPCLGFAVMVRLRSESERSRQGNGADDQRRKAGTLAIASAPSKVAGNVSFQSTCACRLFGRGMVRYLARLRPQVSGRTPLADAEEPRRRSRTRLR